MEELINLAKIHNKSKFNRKADSQTNNTLSRKKATTAKDLAMKRATLWADLPAELLEPSNWLVPKL
jgi:hypothetical protein